MCKGNIFTTAQRRFTLVALLLLALLLAPGVGWGQKTFYSYKSGTWNDENTWTLDPTGTTPVGVAIPGSADNVVIRNGDVVTFTGTTPKISVTAIEIESGATLDLGNSSGHTLGNVNGKGLLRISATTLPSFGSGNFNSVGGGTVEIYAGTDITLTAAATYNNLILNFTNSTNKLIIGGTSSYNFIVNGDLTIKQGGLQINTNNTWAKTLYLNGNVLCSSNAQVSVGKGTHAVYIKGDFINNGGAAKFYSNNGTATVTFNNPSKDQLLQCNGTTKFWNLVVDKGVDDTYMLDVQANAAGNFSIDGAFDGDISNQDSPGSVINNKALEIFAGTLRFGSNIVFNSIATKNYDDWWGQTYYNGAFAIDSDAQLWLDGANVTVNSAAARNSSTIIVYGKLKITGNSTFSSPGSEGIIIRGAGIYEQSGGTSTAGVLRTSARGNLGEHRGGVIMTGGTLTITGNVKAGQYAAFTLPYPSNIFQMSGNAVLDINKSTSSYGDEGHLLSILLSMDPKNASLTGGTVIVRADSRDAGIVSKVPFYNLQLLGSGGNSIAISSYDGYDPGTTDAPMDPVVLQPLVVKNDLTIQRIGTGNLTFNANNQDVTVGEDMLISANATYTSGTNTTRFNGCRPQTHTNNGTANLNNVELVGANTYLTTKTNMQVNGNLTIGDGTTLYDEGKTVTVVGNITNSGKHVSTGSGSITMAGSGKTIGGSGNGVFGVLKLTNGNATLAANQRFDGSVSALRLVNGLLDINSYRLTLGSNASVFSDNGTGADFSAAKMIRTGGLLSDEGVVKDYSGGTYAYPYSFTYPVGFSTSYHPATLELNGAPTQLGQVTVKPVSGAHPLADATKSLACYWKTSVGGFTGLNADWSFKYIPSTDVKPAAADEANYNGAVFRGDKWITDPSVVTVEKTTHNVISTNQPQIDGEYTAGLAAAFSKPNIFYSIAPTGDWNTPGTWSNSPGGTAGSTTPDASSIVVIGDGGAHTVTIPGSISASCKRLIIKAGSTLDVKIPGATETRNFGYLADQSQGGGGTLKVELAAATTLPGGDFSDFCGTNGGTVEYYGSAPRVLPSTSTKSYYNLKSSQTGVTYTFPSGATSIYNDLMLSGSTTASALETNSASTSISVGNNLVLTQGNFNITGTGPHTVTVGNKVDVASAATFQVTSGTTGHAISIAGDLAVAGSFNSANSTLTFKGSNSSEISGAGSVAVNNLVVDKGTSSAVNLNVNCKNTTVSGTTTLVNGNLNVVSDANLNINGASAAFTIPSTAALTVNSSSAEVVINSNNNSNDGDVLLFGKLELGKGRIYVGPKNANYNNDIEIGASGSPTIKVTGGTLYVGGQVRRSVAQFVGSLRYYQDSGTVVVRGINQAGVPNSSLSTFKNNQRAKFEVLNAGSVFCMNGGTLRIAEGGGDNFGDIYVDPESSTVTGGVVELGASGSNFKDIRLSASCILPSVVVGGSITATNTIYPLQILNDLTIVSSGRFKANGLDLTIGRSLFNYQPNDGFQHGAAAGTTQTTTFNRSVDGQIVGTSGSNVTFSTLVVNKPGAKLALGTSSNVLVEKLLDLSAGTLQDKGNTITVKGDMKNTAVHESDANADTGVVFSGTVAQRVWSDVKGVFGNVGINNVKGVTFDDEFTINNRLKFTTGILNIDENLLRLGVNAEIQGASSGMYIMSNGIYRDKGVEKVFPKSVAAVTFVYPLGVAGGKYTPATITLSNNSVDGGSVRILPINSEHPMLVDPATNTPNLDYYWIVEPSSNLTGYTSTMSFTYVSSLSWDSNSKVGRFVTDNWYPLGGITDATINKTAKTFTISNKDYLKGEYTIAHTDNLYGKPVYYSNTLNANGDWDVGSSWLVKKPEDPDDPANYKVPTSGPNGHRVIIKADHTITISQDRRQTYSLELNGTLNLQDKIYHDFRKLSGSGTLKIGAFGGQFLPPGGDLAAFTNQSVSTIELNGAGTLDARFTEFPNLNFTGTGDKVIPLSLNSRYHTVYGNLTIVDGVVKKLGSSNQGILRVYGNWANNKGAGAWVPGTSQVQLVGDRNQTVSIAGTAAEQFYNLQLQKNNSIQRVAFNSSVDVTNLLSLNRGVIDVAAADKVFLRLTSTGAGYTRSGYAIGDAFVDGKMQKNMLSGATFTFPVGDVDHSAPVSVVNTSTSVTSSYWETQYYKASPSAIGSSFDKAQLSSISDREYWRIKNTSSGVSDKAYVRLQWDDFSGMPTVSQSMSKIRVAEYDGTMWKSVSDVANVDKTAKTVQTSTQCPNANADKYYTLSLAGMPTAVLSAPSPTEICGGESTSITLTMTGVGPWKIQYTVDGGTPVPLDVPISPFTFALTGSVIGSAVDKDIDHKVKVVYVKDAAGDENLIASNEVAVKVKRTPNPVIVGPNPSMQGASGVKYSVTAVSGDSYSWSINPSSAGTITAGSTTNEATVTWNSVSSGTISITEKSPSNSCPVTASMVVSLDTKPKPNITANPGLTSCVNSTVVYSTPFYSGNTYSWTIPGISGTDYVIASGAVSQSTIGITWKTPGARQLTVTETKGGTSEPGSIDIQVNSYPLSNKSVSDVTVCKGNAASITVANSELGATYQLYDGTGTPVGGAVNGSGNTITLTPIINVTKGVYTSYEVRASIGACPTPQTDKPTITVLDPVVPTLVSDKGTDVCSSDQIIFTAYDNGAMPSGSVTFYHDGVQVPAEKVVGNTYTAKALGNGAKIYAEIGNGACTATTPVLTMTVRQCLPNDPVNPPTVGSATACASTTAVKTTTDVSLDALPTGATSLVWSVTAGSGTITSTALLTAKVEWTVGYAGKATISVVGSNASGTSVNPTTVDVTVVKVNSGTIKVDTGEPACFKTGTPIDLSNDVTASVTPSEIPTYSWELLTDDGAGGWSATWQSVAGATSNSYTVSTMDIGAQKVLKMKVHRIATSGSCSAISNDIIVNRTPVTGPPYHVGNNVTK